MHKQVKLGEENLSFPEDGEMTQPSRPRIRNSDPGGLRPSMLPLPTMLSFTSGWGRNKFVSFKPPRPGNESQTLA